MLKNTATSYGSVAKWLHWLVALCFLIAYVVIYYKIWFLERGDALYRPSFQIHVTVGMSVLVWASLRLWWRLTNPQPKHPPMPNWQIQSSHWMHWILYFFMFAMPISGWLGYGGSANFILFEVPSFRNSIIGQSLLELTGQTWKEWEVPWDYFHKKISGAWILWIFIVIHAGAAFYHHFVQKDEVLKRMLPGKSE